MSPSRTIALSVAALACLACNPPALPSRRNPDVLIVTVDGLQAGLLRGYGNQGANAPRLDAFAERATVFAQAYAPGWQSAPATASLCTGLHPITHGVRKQGDVLADSQVTIAERLYAEGILTGAIQSDGVLSKKQGFAQGFEVYDESIASSNVDREDTSASVLFPLVTQAAHGWLDERAKDEEDPSWLLWVHYASPVPDWPWAAVDERPVEVVSAFDAAFGSLMDRFEASGALAKTIIIVVGSDGGESAANLPLIVYLPQTIPHRVTTPVSVVDLPPTVLELFLFGVDEEDAPLEGRSLVRALLDLDLDRGPVLTRGETFSAVVSGDWRLDVDRNGLWQRLFHLWNDPGRTLDLSAELESDTVRLAAELAELQAGSFAWPPEPAPQ